MRDLGLHQITAMEAGPVELVAIAAAVGCQQVCLFVHPNPVLNPEQPPPPLDFPTITPVIQRELAARMNDLGVTLSNVEYFTLDARVDVHDFARGLALAGELGAKRAVTHIHDRDPARALDHLGRLGELAARFGLDVAVEFMGLSPGCDSIHRAVAIAQRLGQPNVGIAVDVLHLIRTGGTPADVAAVDPALIKYAQLCDGADLAVSSDYVQEAVFERRVPGEGCFPLPAFIEALPRETPLDVEVPSIARQAQGVSALERSRAAVSAARALIEAAKPSR